MPRLRNVLCLLSLLGGAALASLTPMNSARADEEKPADSSQTSVSFFKDVKPVFQEHCQGCHQPAKRGGDYVMTEFAALLKGGESEQLAVTPGKVDESYLMALITPENGEAEMPKGKKSLNKVELDLIRRWITEGAQDDTPVSNRMMYDMDNPPVYNLPPVISSLDFSPDGKLLAVSGYHEVLLYKADGSGLVARLVGMSERIESAVFSPDGKRLAVTGGSPGRMGELQVWNVAKSELLLSLTIGYDTCYGASWSSDGTKIAFGCPDATVRAVNAETGEQILFNGAHSDWVLDTVFSAKDDHLVSVSRDRAMKLIHLETQRFIDNITSITPGALKGGLATVARHPSKDELLVGGADGAPKIYRMFREKVRKIGDDYNLIRAFEPMPGRLFDVAYSADAAKIAACSSYNGTGEVRVYNEADGKLISRTESANGGLFAVAFTPDGKTIAVGGFDGFIRLINAADGKVVKQFTPVEAQATTAAADK